MRRVIRAVCEEKPIGDVSTLEYDTSVTEMRGAYDELKAEISKYKSP
jgi:hypothetical protein